MSSLMDWELHFQEKQVPPSWIFITRTMAFFIGYTTSSDTSEPEYSIAVRIANGYTSGNACLTANDILKYIYNLADEDTILTGYASSDTSNTSND